MTGPSEIRTTQTTCSRGVSRRPSIFSATASSTSTSATRCETTVRTAGIRSGSRPFATPITGHATLQSFSSRSIRVLAAARSVLGVPRRIRDQDHAALLSDRGAHAWLATEVCTRLSADVPRRDRGRSRFCERCIAAGADRRHRCRRRHARITATDHVRLHAVSAGGSRVSTDVSGRGRDAGALTRASRLRARGLVRRGLPDVVQLGDERRYWKNLGDGRFDVPRVFAGLPPGVRLGSAGTQLADLDGDGQIDLLVVSARARRIHAALARRNRRAARVRPVCERAAVRAR